MQQSPSVRPVAAADLSPLPAPASSLIPSVKLGYTITPQTCSPATNTVVAQAIQTSGEAGENFVEFYHRMGGEAK